MSPPAVSAAPVVPASAEGAALGHVDNPPVAALLREMARLLQAQGEESPFRVAAYQRAADTVAQWARSVREIARDEGLAGLDALPTVGPGIASAIDEIVRTGHWGRLERLRGAAGPPVAWRAVPAMGEQAAGGAPAVELILQVDALYRARASAGQLPTIAPRQFNPEGKAWLPVLHTRLGGWHFTALYSNTARAHELDRVKDWVVVYAEGQDHHERQFTVVTAQRGTLVGQRVVRGREVECRAWYSRGDAPEKPPVRDAPTAPAAAAA